MFERMDLNLIFGMRKLKKSVAENGNFWDEISLVLWDSTAEEKLKMKEKRKEKNYFIRKK